MNDGMWSVVHGPDNDWVVNYCGKQQGCVGGSMPKEDVINYWRTEIVPSLPDSDAYRTFRQYDEEEITGGCEVNSPEHYTVGGFEAIDVIKAKLTKEEWIGYCKGNVLKYMMRSNYKGSHDNDVGKAEYYVCSMMETIEDGEEESNYNIQVMPNPPF